MTDCGITADDLGAVSRDFFSEPDNIKYKKRESTRYHFPECMAPPDIKDNYDEFIEWCHKKGIREIGHAVVPMVSTKLRAKPVNLRDFEKCSYENGSELDGSSFATGGGRVVHRSKVSAVPDKEGIWFMFPDPIRRTTLYIMSDMVSPQGVSMCARKPLSDSLKLLNKSLSMLLKTVGKKEPGKNEKCTLTIGYEKEFFIIPKEVEENRLDLRYLGQTVVGGPGPINQNFQGVYLTIPKRKEEAMFNEIVKELAMVGITASQKHLEVGQSGDELKGRQCEVVLKYKDAMEATDCDLIARQILEDVCDRHGFRALISSKPFTDDTEGNGINGSGKHTNMSVCLYNTERREIIENLFEDETFRPSKSQENVNIIGLALLAGMGRHWQVLDSAVASRGNEERRRPGYEAPVYLSAFIGNTSEFRESLQQDRNRSVSIGLSGNKLEWRVPGANTPMHYPIAFIALAMNEVIEEITLAINKGLAKNEDLQKIIDREYKRLRKEIDYFIVDEDVYELSKEEASKRFRYTASENTPEAMKILDDHEKTEFLTSQGVFTEDMLRAFKMIQLETYNKRISAESQIMARMSKILSNKVFRSALMQRYSRELFDIDPRLKQRQDYLGMLNADLLALIDSSYLENEYRRDEGTDLKTILGQIKNLPTEEMTAIVTDKLLPHLASMRKIYEQIVDIMGGGEEVEKL